MKIDEYIENNNEEACLSNQQLFDYIDKKLNTKEQHAVEKHILNCSFCADALEGIENNTTTIQANNTLKEVQTKLYPETKKDTIIIPLYLKHKKAIRYAIAASVILCVSSLFILTYQQKNNEILVADELKKETNETVRETPSNSFSNSNSEYPASDSNKSATLENVKNTISNSSDKNFLIKDEKDKTTTNSVPNNVFYNSGSSAGMAANEPKPFAAATQNVIENSKSDNNINQVISDVQMDAKEEDARSEIKLALKESEKKTNVEKKNNNKIMEEDAESISPQKTVRSLVVQAPVSEGKTLVKRKQSKKAEKSYDQEAIDDNRTDSIITIGGVANNSFFSAGKAEYENKNYLQAIQLLKSDIEKNKENYDALFYLGKSYFAIGENEKAVISFNFISDQSILFDDAQWELSQVLLTMKKKDDAAKILEALSKRSKGYRSKANKQLESIK